MSLYPNTRIELTEQWLSDIKILKDKINSRVNDNCLLEEMEAKRLVNFIERCVLEFDLFQENYYICRINATKDKIEYDDYLAWDDLNMLRDYLISYRVQLLERQKVCEFKILFDLAKSEAKNINNIEVIEQLENIEIDDITQNRGTLLMRWVGKLNTPIGEIICDKLCNLASSVAEGVTTATLNHYL